MMQKPFNRLFLPFLALILLLAGCAAPEPKLRIFWPPPPGDPRLEFIGVYSSQHSFPKTATQRRLESITGRADAAEFISPFGIVSDGRGIVYVSDVHLRNVRVYDFNNQKVDFLSKTPIFDTPMGMALDRQGRLYIADSVKKMVLVFSPARTPLASIGSSKQLSRPVYLAVHDDLGRLYVSDGQQHQIVVFDLQGKHLFTFGQLGGGDGDFFAPQGMAFSPEGLLYVADQFNARIQVFQPDGTFVRAFGERGSQQSQFELPKDLSFDSEGNLWVVDGRRPHILTYSPDGQLLLVTGSKALSSTPLGFGTARAIHVDSRDRVHVSDMLNHRFSVWQYLSADYLREQPIAEDDLRRTRGAIERASRETKQQTLK